MSIRKIVTAAVAAVALSAGAANAETALSYYVGGQVAFSEVEAGPVDDNFTNFGVNGAVAFAASENIGIQLDASADFIDEDLGDDDVFSGTAHVFHRNADALIGAFLGVVSDDDDTTWGGGVEGAMYNDAWVFNGALTYATNDDSDTDLWLIDGSVEYFYNENLASEFGLGFGNEDGGAGDSDFWTVNAGVKYQLASAPVGLSAHIAYSDFDDADFSETAILLGVNYVFSGESLHERTTAGASQRGFLRGPGL